MRNDQQTPYIVHRAIPSAVPQAERKAVELIRVSTAAQAGEDRAGIPAQKSACKQIATRHKLKFGWDPIMMIGISGAEVMHSPEMRRLLEIIRSGKCCGVVMKEISRMMRPDNYDEYVLLQVLKDHGVPVYTQDNFFDLGTESGRFMMSVYTGMSGYEKGLIRRRLQDAREELRVEGKCAGGLHTLPLGVTYDKKTFTWSYVEPGISRVIRLFELFTSGVTSFRELAQKTGIGYYSIPQLLRNPIYTGWRVYSKMRDSKNRRVVAGRYKDAPKIARPEPLRVKVMDKGAVSDATFAQAQKVLDLKGQMRWKRNVDGADPFVYRGLLRCGQCGERMTTLRHHKGQGKSPRDYYVCRNVHGDQKLDKQAYTWKWATKNGTCSNRRMRRARVEEMLDKLIREKLSDPKYLGSLLEAQRQSVAKNDTHSKSDRLERDLATITMRRGKLTEVYLDQELSKEDYKRRRAELDDQETQIRLEISKIRPTVPRLSAEALAVLLMPFRNWRHLKPAEKRALLLQTIPVFNVSAKDSGYNQAEYKVDGFFLTIVGEDDPKPVASAKARRAETRINSGGDAGVGNENHLQSDHITNPLPGMVGNTPSLYIALQA